MISKKNSMTLYLSKNRKKEMIPVRKNLIFEVACRHRRNVRHMGAEQPPSPHHNVVLSPRGSSSFTPQRRFTPYTPHTPPLLPYPVYPVYPRGEDIPRIPPCSGYTPYTLLFWIYPVYPVYPIYPIYPVYPACADLPRFTPISDPLAALSDIFSPNNCAKPIARIERASRSRSAATPS